MDKIERILLIQPPATSFTPGDLTPNMPLGLAYIAAVLEKEGYNVKILDALVEGWDSVDRALQGGFRIGLSLEEIGRRVRDFSPQVVGISSMFTAQWHNTLQITQLMKSLDNSLKVVVGGAHPTAMPQEVLKDENADFFVIGEGERAFLKLIRALESKDNLDNIGGLAFRRGGRNFINYEQDYISDLDTLPYPARHLLPLEKYFRLRLSHGGKRKRGRFSPIVTSRGCPAECIFCSASKLWGKRYRARSPENVIAEIKMLKEDFGIDELSIEDDNFTLNKERAHKICELMIAEKLNLAWDTPNGIAAYSLDKDLIKAMKESGCYRINFPIESGNQEFLTKVIKKPLELKRIPELVKYAKDVGLEVNAFFVAGLPGETEETLKDSFAFAKKLGIFRPFISVAVPYPGSRLLELCVEKGFLAKGFNLSRLTIHQYNIETPQLPILRLKKILEKEVRKLRFYDIINSLKSPRRLFGKTAGFLSRLTRF